MTWNSKQKYETCPVSAGRTQTSPVQLVAIRGDVERRNSQYVRGMKILILADYFNNLKVYDAYLQIRVTCTI